jgi:hypothetical protein
VGGKEPSVKFSLKITAACVTCATHSVLQKTTPAKNRIAPLLKESNFLQKKPVKKKRNLQELPGDIGQLC